MRAPSGHMTTPTLDRIRLGQGTLEYYDSGGPGPCLVLLHGAMMDHTVWADVVDALAPRFRCVVPLLPVGAHRIAMPEGADVSPRGLATVVADLLEALGLDDVTLVGNDTGGAIAQLLVTSRAERVAALVLTSCDAFDNFPPGLPGRTMATLCRVPGGLYAAMLSLRIPALRRLPMTFGWMARQPIPSDMFARWLNAFLSNPAVRRDVIRMMRGVDDRDLTAAAEQLRRFDRPALVIWAAGDKVMPVSHAFRLAELLPQAPQPILIEDSSTLIPIDQPRQLAHAIEQFMTTGGTPDDTHRGDQ